MVNKEETGTPRQGKTVVQWIAAIIGLTLTLTLIALVSQRAVEPGPPTPPLITIRAEHISAAGPGYLVQFTAYNKGDQTAAEVTVEGKISNAMADEETSTATLNYIPGKSIRKGGLFFSKDPNSGTLELRALGYAKP